MMTLTQSREITNACKWFYRGQITFCRHLLYPLLIFLTNTWSGCTVLLRVLSLITVSFPLIRAKLHHPIQKKKKKNPGKVLLCSRNTTDDWLVKDLENLITELNNVISLFRPIVGLYDSFCFFSGGWFQPDLSLFINCELNVEGLKPI